MDDEHTRRRIGAAGREWARAMSVSSYADRFLAFVDNEVRPFRPLLALADRAASTLVSMQASPSLPVVERVAGELAKLAPPDVRLTAESEPALTFRELGPHDAGSLGALFEANDIPGVVDHFDPFPLTHAIAAELTDPGRKDRFYGAFLEDRLVGFSMLRGWDEGYEVPSFGVLVDRVHYGSGIGSRLTDFTLEQARALSSPRVRLSVYGTNERAYAMYARKGFVEESRAQVGRRLGPDERIVMVLEF
jgi:ribosomal protein S18 acetylase RimI-like enzyme